MNTHITVKNDRFLINEQLTYREIKDCPSGYHGLLMNARMIQGIFDDRFQPERFNRFNRVFSADQNTKDLIAALPTWYQYGLRAITVGFQGGGPCFTINNQTIDNNPFQPDGLGIDQNYLDMCRQSF